MISKKLSSLSSKALFSLTCLTLLIGAVAKPAAAAPGWAYRTDRIVGGPRECLRNGQTTLRKLGINAQTLGNEVHGYTRDGKNGLCRKYFLVTNEVSRSRSVKR